MPLLVGNASAECYSVTLPYPCHGEHDEELTAELLNSRSRVVCCKQRWKKEYQSDINHSRSPTATLKSQLESHCDEVATNLFARFVCDRPNSRQIV